MNVIARLEYELAYYDSAVHRFNPYTTRTPPKMFLTSCLKIETRKCVNPKVDWTKKIKKIQLNWILGEIKIVKINAKKPSKTLFDEKMKKIYCFFFPSLFFFFFFFLLKWPGEILWLRGWWGNWENYLSYCLWCKNRSRLAGSTCKSGSVNHPYGYIGKKNRECAFSWKIQMWKKI